MLVFFLIPVNTPTPSTLSPSSTRIPHSGHLSKHPIISSLTKLLSKISSLIAALYSFLYSFNISLSLIQAFNCFSSSYSVISNNSIISL